MIKLFLRFSFRSVIFTFRRFRRLIIANIIWLCCTLIFGLGFGLFFLVVRFTRVTGAAFALLALNEGYGYIEDIKRNKFIS